MKMLTLLAAILLGGRLMSSAATVTSNADSGSGTLRDAIAAAASGEVINFAITGTITLTTGELFIDQDLIITGPGAALLTVQRSTVPATPNFRIFNVSAGDVAISGLTIQNGREIIGAGINNEETLALTNVVIVGNEATEGGGLGGLGGGINNNGTLVIVGSVIATNRAVGTLGSGAGGGINNAGALFITDSEVRGNITSGLSGANGGGIRNEAFLSALRLRLEHNTAAPSAEGQVAEGGGIFNLGTVILDDSTVNLNQALGGTGMVGGEARGGGVFNTDGTVTLRRSTISRNTAQGGSGNSGGGSAVGGGLANAFGTLVLTNSTVSLNASVVGSGTTELPARGGGLFTDTGTVRLYHTTVVSNSVVNVSSMDGGGLSSSLGTIEIRNTILAGNLATVDLATDDTTVFDSGGFNRIGTTNGPVAPGPDDQFNVTAAQLKLGSLQNNGGPTETHALNCGSVAVDAGDNTGAPPTDQRGFDRIVNGVIDIGAYEAAAFGSPGVVLTVSCGMTPARLGESSFFSGSVSNSGSVVLTNVVIVTDRPVPNSSITNVDRLEVGETLAFTSSFLVPITYTNCIITNTVTVLGSDVCSGNLTSDTASLACPVAHQLLLLCPSNVTVQCANLIPPPNAATVAATFTAQEAVVEFGGDTFTTNGCVVQVTRLYVANDSCGNAASCTQTITVQDTTPPVLSGVPTNQTFQCLRDVPPSATVTALDNCDGNVAVTVASSISGSCPSIITITWLAVDRCGNTNNATQVITVRDATPPMLLNVPTNQAYQCLADVPPPAMVLALDNCGEAMEATVSATTNGTCPALVIYCWSATDSCTNRTIGCQTNTVRDTMPPTLSVVPTNLAVQCFRDVPAPPTLTATDNCDGQLQVTPASSISGTCPTVITRTWTAVDRCGNPVTASQTITVDDTMPPVLSQVPSNQTYQCLSDVPPPPALSASDNCDTNVSATVIGTTNGSCPMVIIYCWQAVDGCGNPAQACQTNVVRDTMAPVLSGVPPNQTYASLADVPPPANVMATDRCDGSVSVTRVSVTNDFCPGSGILVVHCWTATDRCTNSVMACQTNLVACPGNPCLDLVKTAQSTMALPGSTVTYNYLITNCGGVRLTNITVLDDNGTPGVPGDDFFVATNLTLLPGQSTNLTASVLFPTRLCPLAAATSPKTAHLVPAPCVPCVTNIAVATVRFGNQVLTREDDAVVCAITNQVPCPEEFAYWKKNIAKWPAAYNPNQTLGLVFAKAGSAANKTLLSALDGKAGNSKAQKELFRQAVTALLNAATPSISFTFTVNDIITGVHMALMNGSDQALNNLTALLTAANGQKDCQPGSQGCLLLTKQVACLLPNDNCGPFGGWALGYKTITNTPAFCFSITISNCGSVSLTNLSVVDSHLGNLTANFVASPTTPLAPGQAITRFYKLAPNSDTTNTATVTGKASQTVGSSGQAVAFVAEASMVCESVVTSPDDLDGSVNNGHVQLPTDGTAHEVTFQVIVRNTGDVGLTNVTVTATNLLPFGCEPPAPFSLAAGQAVTNTLCVGQFACPATVVNEMSVRANIDNVSGGCAYDIRGSNMVLHTACDSSIGCEAAGGTCRMTGGGRQDSSFPPVSHVSHGGQIGSPVGNVTEFDPDSPCIQGNWQHTRHGSGNDRGNFHAKSFDSLMCACLGCPDNPGSGVVIGGLCNSDDRVCGPEPRRAPANKISFSGVGDYGAGGGRVARSAVFRVDVEDRGEPGNSNAGGGTALPDRHRIRIWVLTDAEAARLNNPNDRLLDFRQAIACSVGSAMLTDGAVGANGQPVPLGTAVFGVRAPDIDDGGVMDHGNHQLHPGHKSCSVKRGDTVGGVTNPPPPVVVGVCPQGSDFWKTSPDQWTVYSPNQAVSSLFGNTSKQATNRSLLDAVAGKAGTGSEKELLQQAVTALLNANRPGVMFPFATGDIISGVNTVLQNRQNAAPLTALLQEANEATDCN